MTKTQKYHAVSLFSGGLDSIVATRTIMEQGLSVLCLHFYSPFFGKPHKIKEWERLYKLKIKTIDVGDEYVEMLLNQPKHGFGSGLNPCVDCKILMLSKAKEIMENLGAEFIISGEVVGQRPMSQRSDTLHIIRRDAEVENILLRPLCVQAYKPIAAEESGLVNRDLLHKFYGRGRSDQIALAKKLEITTIPNAAGGCLLTEKENVKRYRYLISRLGKPQSSDFYLANLGRQYWYDKAKSHEENQLLDYKFPVSLTFETDQWFCVGRNQYDNQDILKYLTDADLLFKIVGFAAPLSVCRLLGEENLSDLQKLASFALTFSPKATAWSKEHNSPITVRILTKKEVEEARKISEHMPGGREFLVYPLGN
ncbi:hypothetical protein [Desulfovibrio litoralis]|uniref:Thiamine biosynthesis protein (ThiI) n=1 Tax=Desulfovibrio litoralis DSM 11393 TaxID=1121455 RepID=A0A1M7T6I6_9BACT|nr:hypothetical protein [Desulfovibrio litoralis]SHN66327.1 Thiamine biosynthesis protein (ThiI) [Desulfovibrio litoralis DSM 11393]